MWNKFNGFRLAACCLLCCLLWSKGSIKGESRQASDIFNGWINRMDGLYQTVFPSIALDSIKPVLSQENNSIISARIKQTVLWEQYKTLENHLFHDTRQFVSFLPNIGIKGPKLNEEEASLPIQDIIIKYCQFVQFLCEGLDKDTRERVLFELANKFFTFSFANKYWGHVSGMFYDSAQYPMLRFLYSMIWFYLAGNGWKHWSLETLHALKSRIDTTKGTVVYIAGGTDIYQLLSHGIYNIHVIDPYFPTQTNYYTRGWLWLLHGAIGDIFTLKDQSGALLTIKREFCDEKITMWVVYKNQNRRCGSVILERRRCRQQDFSVSVDDVLLMSCNELYFIIASNSDISWGIDFMKFSPKFTMFVKQLHQPVTKSILCHMHQADSSPFNFIKLGTAVT